MPSSDSAGSPESGPSVGTIIKKGLEGSKAEYAYSLETLYTSPCFRNSLLWGIGLGIGVGLHRFKETQAIWKSCDWAVGSFCLVSAGGWLSCRYQELSTWNTMQDWYRERQSAGMEAAAEQVRLAAVDRLPLPSDAAGDFDAAPASSAAADEEGSTVEVGSALAKGAPGVIEPEALRSGALPR